MSKYDIDEIVKTIKTEGIAVIEGVLSEEYCDNVKIELNNLVNKRLEDGHYCGNEVNQVLDNYFIAAPQLLNLLTQDVTDKVMRKFIDNDYVLISPSARNRRILKDQEFGRKTSGHGWHTDSRFIGEGQGLRPSLCYMSILCIDDFTRDNGATHYIPKSHLRYERPKDRDAELEFEYLEAPKGSIVIFDTALWHKIGEASEKSRWGVFNTYGPWFMKPYHRFDQMFSDEEMMGFDPLIRQLLHHDSIVPGDHNERMATLRRVNG